MTVFSLPVAPLTHECTVLVWAKRVLSTHAHSDVMCLQTGDADERDGAKQRQMVCAR